MSIRAGEFIFSSLEKCMKGLVYPGVVPEGQKQWPVLVYQVNSTNPANVLDSVGPVAGEKQCQLDFYAETQAAADKCARECLEVLFADGRLVCIQLNDRQVYEPEVKKFRASIEVSIWETY